ncbi:MAG: hypothetical protein NDP13_03935 [Crenarchaeota archaeon]|nr:hypothetical protein [Thermoproteota archaeon]MCR8455164.1 hypothetical protein [Thermoproteota archaeon]MCR8471908.1 hypothetical protein [Thermoproteota archaeon]MCR8473347.1 hypothetical protein [Thermoproteota archaeon]MCR8487423.1 hypothetical protein [Thermoproteota archaeon]
MSVEKSYEYMMDSLMRIISFVREVSIEWWWFEQGSIPVVNVRKLEIGDKISFDYLPKMPLLEALRVIQSNFELIRKLQSKDRIDYALKTAQDLYLVLQAVSYIIDAHNLAEELHAVRESISKSRPEALDEFIDAANNIIKRLREILALDVFSWPSEREKIKKEVKKVLELAEKLTAKRKETASVIERVVQEEEKS